MLLNTIHHIAIIGLNREKSTAFYQTLGFRVIRETYRPEQQDWKIDLQMGDVELELFIRPSAPARPSYPEACGLRHLAFRVASVADTVQELAGLGIPCEPIRLDSITGKPMTFFHDPDGLPLELHE